MYNWIWRGGLKLDELEEPCDSGQNLTRRFVVEIVKSDAVGLLFGRI